MSHARPSIRAIGSALPAASLAQEEIGRRLAAAAGLPDAARRKLRALHERSGISRRHGCAGNPEQPFGFLTDHLADPSRVPAPGTAARMAAYAKHAPVLAERACRDALARCGALEPRRIGHVIAVSCTGFMAPGLDVLLTHRLGLDPSVRRTLVGFQGCQAGLTALRLAATECEADPEAVVLVACVELSSLHLQSEPSDDNLLANSLFADGAAAVLVAGANVATTGPRLAVERTACRLSPQGLGDMTWTVGDHGFELHLSRLVPRLLGMDIRPFVLETLGFKRPEDLASRFWAVHPGGVAILDALERALELPPDRLAASRAVLRDCGNMSSPTVHFVLRRLMEDAATPERGVALAFGPGLSVECAVLAREGS